MYKIPDNRVVMFEVLQSYHYLVNLTTRHIGSNMVIVMKVDQTINCVERLHKRMSVGTNSQRDS